MRVETWDPTAKVRYDQQLWNELVSLRFLDAAHGALVIGPVVIKGSRNHRFYVHNDTTPL
jgi:hypothetical protein